MVPVSSLKVEKQTLRRLMGARRDGLAAAERLRRSAATSAHLTALPEFSAARTISGFVAVKGEIDPADALGEARRQGKTVVLPRVSNRGAPRLRFHRADDASALRTGRFGLIEPDPGCPEVPADAIDLLLVPGLAFDASGRRLGYGRGYFDEVASRLRTAGAPGVLAGVGFGFQIVDRVPAGTGDVPVHVVVTDLGVLRCGAP